MKNPKEYQKKAINKLVGRFKSCIVGDEEADSVTLWAPTGSGKTFIMTKVLEMICRDDDLNEMSIVFIWASIGTGNLNVQSYKSVRSELEGSPECHQLDPSYIETHEVMGNKEILFVNWESVIRQNTRNGQWINNMMREGEQRNLQTLLEQTRQANYKICLIVDESHIGQDQSTQISAFKTNIIQPDFTFEMSASPDPNSFDNRWDVKIEIGNVQSEGMMKQGIKINSGIVAENDNNRMNDETLTKVLNTAERKRKEILDQYRQIGSNVNPLVLVQIPDSDAGQEMRDFTVNFLSSLDNSITDENGRLGFWFDNEKNFNSEEISQNDNQIEYLIFKRAIETGWDCPRAHILVKFREGNAPVPLIQTIGRIYRTAEARKYDNDILDYGYIFTNMERLHISDLEQLGNGGKDISVHVVDGKNKTLLGLNSFRIPRESSRLDIDYRINPIIESKICETFQLTDTSPYLDTVLDLTDLTVSEQFIADKDVTLQEIQEGNDIEGNLAYGLASEIEIRNKAMKIITDNSNGLSSTGSINTLKTALCSSIQNHSQNPNPNNIYVLLFVLIVKYSNQFANIINLSTLEFKNRYKTIIRGHYDAFEIPDTKYYSSRSFRRIESQLSLYDSMYVPTATPALEDTFCFYLHDHFSESIEWIWHNGQEHSDENFGIEMGEGENLFRPDFIVKFTNGRIGIFDTKPSNDRVEETRERAEALYRYIHDSTITPTYVFGGIVVQRGTNFYINQQENYFPFDEQEHDYQLIGDVFI